MNSGISSFQLKCCHWKWTPSGTKQQRSLILYYVSNGVKKKLRKGIFSCQKQQEWESSSHVLEITCKNEPSSWEFIELGFPKRLCKKTTLWWKCAIFLANQVQRTFSLKNTINPHNCAIDHLLWKCVIFWTRRVQWTLSVSIHSCQRLPGPTLRLAIIITLKQTVSLMMTCPYCRVQIFEEANMIICDDQNNDSINRGREPRTISDRRIMRNALVVGKCHVAHILHPLVLHGYCIFINMSIFRSQSNFRQTVPGLRKRGASRSDGWFPSENIWKKKTHRHWRLWRLW